MIRINKVQARKQYNAGGTVYVLPCKVRFDNMWIAPFQMNREHLQDEDFDKVINAYEFYNCMSETGRRSAFYIES